MNHLATTFYEVLRESIDTTPRLRVMKGRLVRMVGDRVVAVFGADTKPFRRPKPRMFEGLKIMVENPVGSTRSGVDRTGRKWSVTMKNDYGYLSRTTGADGEGIDVFLASPIADNDGEQGHAFIVHQNDPSTGHYDEDKVMLGFADTNHAKAAYLANYDRPDFFRSITSMPMTTFKGLLATGGKMKWKRKGNASLSAMFASDFMHGESTQGHLRWIDIGAEKGESEAIALKSPTAKFAAEFFHNLTQYTGA